MLSLEIANCTTKAFPEFIKHNYVITNNIKIDKIFPKIGLSNSKEKINPKLDFTNVKLDSVIHTAISKFIAEFNSKYCLEDFKSQELYKVSTILYIFDELNKRLLHKKNITCVNGGVYLATPIMSYDDKALIKSNTDVFKLAKNLLTHGEKYSKIDLVSIKEISRQCKNLQIAFSSDGINGAWDIATMSMRGIKSCMRWQARQSASLVGSIIDPYCGIIYLTNGTSTSFGSKMLFRAVVRFIFDKNNEPSLFIDKLYSAFYKSSPAECIKLDEQIKNLFVEYIKKQQPNIGIIKSIANVDDYYIPNFDFNSALRPEQISYRDTQLPYREVNADALRIIKSFQSSTKNKHKLKK